MAAISKTNNIRNTFLKIFMFFCLCLFPQRRGKSRFRRAMEFRFTAPRSRIVFVTNPWLRLCRGKSFPLRRASK